MVIAVSCLLCTSQVGSAQSQQWRSVEEYGFGAMFPRGARLCEALTGGSHLHGWAMPLYGDCEQMHRRIGVWADWNASFAKSPEEAAFCSPEEGGSLTSGTPLRLAFPTGRSATCRYDQGGGAIVIDVVTQAWRWPEWRTTSDPDMRAPLVSYSAYLRTDASHLDQDLRVFRQVLRSVRFWQPDVE